MTLRIGVVGGGNYGHSHLEVFRDLEASGRVKLVGLADQSETRRAQRREEFDIPVYETHAELLEREDLDGVTVATPDNAHFPVASDVLKRGLHCFVEKPLDTTVEGCRELVRLAKEKNRLLEVDFHKRFDPYHIEMREAVLEGRFGEVEYGYAWMEDQIWVPTGMLAGWSEQSSPLWFLGVHMIDLARWMMGNPAPVGVYATGGKKKLAAMGFDTFDSIQAQVAFENGANITFHHSWILPNEFEAVVHQGIKLVGTEGIFECDSQYRGGRGCLKGEAMKTWNLGIKYRERDKRNKFRWKGYYYSSIADFAENLSFLEDGGTLDELEGLYPSGGDGLVVTAIACAAHESIVKRQPIEIEAR